MSLKPVKVTEVKPGVKVYDFGQNAAQMPRLKVKGEAGGVVRITPAELLNEDGTAYSAWAKRGSSYWQYTLAGTGSEMYFPKFFYYGCRYLQVETTNAEVEAIEGVVVHSSAKPVGEFSCSNELFNRIHTLVRWAQRSNMMSVLTDARIARNSVGSNNITSTARRSGTSSICRASTRNVFRTWPTRSMETVSCRTSRRSTRSSRAAFWIHRNGAARSSSRRGSNTNLPATSIRFGNTSTP